MGGHCFPGIYFSRVGDEEVIISPLKVRSLDGQLLIFAINTSLLASLIE